MSRTPAGASARKLLLFTGATEELDEEGSRDVEALRHRRVHVRGEYVALPRDRPEAPTHEARPGSQTPAGGRARQG